MPVGCRKHHKWGNLLDVQAMKNLGWAIHLSKPKPCKEILIWQIIQSWYQPLSGSTDVVFHPDLNTCQTALSRPLRHQQIMTQL